MYYVAASVCFLICYYLIYGQTVIVEVHQACENPIKILEIIVLCIWCQWDCTNSRLGVELFLLLHSFALDNLILVKLFDEYIILSVD